MKGTNSKENKKKEKTILVTLFLILLVFLLILLIFLSILLVLSAFFPNLFDFNFWQSFLANGFATLLGVILGIPAGILLNKYIEKLTEKEHKERIAESLYYELKINNQLITDNKIAKWLPNNDFTTKVLDLHTNLRDEVWRAFSDGGELKWIKDSELLFSIANAYYFVKTIKFSSKNYFNYDMFNTRNAPGAEEGYRENNLHPSLIRKMKESMSSINEALDKLGNIIGKEKRSDIDEALERLDELSDKEEDTTPQQPSNS